MRNWFLVDKLWRMYRAIRLVVILVRADKVMPVDARTAVTVAWEIWLKPTAESRVR